MNFQNDISWKSYLLSKNEISRNLKGFNTHSQIKCAIDTLRKYVMLNYNFALTFVEAKQIIIEGEDDEVVDPKIIRKLIDSIRYLCQSRLDTCFPLGVVRSYMSESLKFHFLIVKCVLK